MLGASGARCLVQREAAAEREMPGGAGGGKSVLEPAGPGADDRHSPALRGEALKDERIRD